MVILVTLGALLGVIIVPLIDKDKDKKVRQSKRTTLYKYLYFFMIALGTSALLSDAVLHLVPHVSSCYSTYMHLLYCLSYMLLPRRRFWNMFRVTPFI